MKIELNNTSDEMNVKIPKEELRKVYSNYDKFVMYEFMFGLLKIVGDMYKHIMSDEKETDDRGTKNDERRSNMLSGRSKR